MLAKLAVTSQCAVLVTLNTPTTSHPSHLHDLILNLVKAMINVRYGV